MPKEPDLAPLAFAALSNAKGGDTDLYTERGRCRGCGECCGRYLPLSLADRLRLHSYVVAHGVRPHPERGAVDLTCPYLTDGLDCAVYPARPAICRAYRCDRAAKRDFAGLAGDPAFQMGEAYEPAADLRRFAESIETGGEGHGEQ